MKIETFIVILIIFLMFIFVASYVIATLLKKRQLDPMATFDRQYRMVEYFIRYSHERNTSFEVIKGMFEELKSHPLAKSYSEKIEVLENEFYLKFSKLCD